MAHSINILKYISLYIYKHTHTYIMYTHSHVIGPVTLENANMLENHPIYVDSDDVIVLPY